MPNDNDLIRRGDARKAVNAIFKGYPNQPADAIAALPAVTVGHHSPSFASGVEAFHMLVEPRLRALIDDMEAWVSNAHKDASEPVTPARLTEDQIRQLVEEAPMRRAERVARWQADPQIDAMMRCAECFCDDGNCKWIATDEDSYPYDAVEENERDLDGVDADLTAGQRLIQGAKEALAYARGETSSVVVEHVFPDTKPTLEAAATVIRDWAMREIVVDSCIPKENREPGCLSCDTLEFLEAMDEALGRAAMRGIGENHD